MPKVKKSQFQSDWLTIEKYSAWMQWVLSGKSKGIYSICKAEFDVSNMSVSAADSHATGKTHTQFSTATTSSAIFSSGELVFNIVIIIFDHFGPVSSHKELYLCCRCLSIIKILPTILGRIGLQS